MYHDTFASKLQPTLIGSYVHIIIKPTTNQVIIETSKDNTGQIQFILHSILLCMSHTAKIFPTEISECGKQLGGEG